jgi:hypothetical protein
VNTLNYTKTIIAELKNAPIFSKIVADLGSTAKVIALNATPAKVAIAA